MHTCEFSVICLMIVTLQAQLAIPQPLNNCHHQQCLVRLYYMARSAETGTINEGNKLIYIYK